MFRSTRIALVICAAASLAACNPITIPNPFGTGPALVLTGNAKNDAPSWRAFTAGLKAGVKADEAAARQFFLDNCPAVQNASVQVATTSAVDVAAATGGIVSETAAQKQINNVQQGLSEAQSICAAGTAGSWVTAVKNATVAFQTIASWFKSS